MGLYNVDALDKGAGLWTLDTRVRRPSDVVRWSMLDNLFGESTSVGKTLSANSDYHYKTYFKNWKDNKSFESQHIAMIRPPEDLTRVGNKIRCKIPATDSTHIVEKTSYPKTPTTDSSMRTEKDLKSYIPEDHESDPSLQDSSSRKIDFSNNKKYKSKRCD